jgi:hypothetical protein
MEKLPGGNQGGARLRSIRPWLGVQNRCRGSNTRAAENAFDDLKSVSVRQIYSALRARLSLLHAICRVPGSLQLVHIKDLAPSVRLVQELPYWFVH